MNWIYESKIKELNIKNTKMSNQSKRVSKTKAIEIINSTKGRFFTVTFVKKDNKERTINCNTKKNSIDKLGYIKVYSPKDKSYKQVNSQTIKQIVFDNIIYKVR